MHSTLTLGGTSRSNRGGGKPHLFLALECQRPFAAGARHGLAGLDVVTLGRGAERSAVRLSRTHERSLRIQVPDRWMSTSHARLLHVLGRWVLEDTESKNGCRVNGATITRAVLADGDVVELGHTFFVYREAIDADPDALLDLDASAIDAPVKAFATLLPALAGDFARATTVARSDVSVVLRGESGTGKELAARGIHELSRRSGPFIAVNCGALPETLLASELFGYRRGAFSGATEDRPGLVRAAHRGTLFLDEIGDLPLSSQPALLRVLQEREVTPVGASQAVVVDIRLVTATHRDMAGLVEAGKFRADLLARIAGFELELPPLRRRREDLGLLVAELLRRSSGGREATFTLDAARALFRYEMPLNVRELEKVLGAAVVLARGGPIEVAHMPEALRTALEAKRPTDAPAPPPEPEADADHDDDEAPLDPARPLSALDQRRRDALVGLLREHGGNVSAVARALGKARMQVQRWMKRFGLDPSTFRP